MNDETRGFNPAEESDFLVLIAIIANLKHTHHIGRKFKVKRKPIADIRQIKLTKRDTKNMKFYSLTIVNVWRTSFSSEVWPFWKTGWNFFSWWIEELNISILPTNVLMKWNFLKTPFFRARLKIGKVDKYREKLCWLTDCLSTDVAIKCGELLVKKHVIQPDNSNN